MTGRAMDPLSPAAVAAAAELEADGEEAGPQTAVSPPRGAQHLLYRHVLTPSLTSSGHIPAPSIAATEPDPEAGVGGGPSVGALWALTTLRISVGNPVQCCGGAEPRKASGPQLRGFRGQALTSPGFAEFRGLCLARPERAHSPGPAEAVAAWVPRALTADDGAVAGARFITIRKVRVYRTGVLTPGCGPDGDMTLGVVAQLLRTHDVPAPWGAEPALEPTRMQMPQGNPLGLRHSLQELLARDSVQVELSPEKKGLFLKHVEYEVSSQRFRSSVYRRYNDFVVFHEMLLHKFPYRMVPALPPKRMLGADREFIEARRRALKRFINLVARHPCFSEDVLLQLFLSFSGSDVQNKLKETVQAIGDEFLHCQVASRAKDLLPADIQAQFAASRELVRNMYNSFSKLRDRAERMASRAIDHAADLLIFGKELRQVTLALGSDTTPLPPWAALSSSTWGVLKQALKGLSVEFALLADKAAQQGKLGDSDVVEKLNLFLDLLQSYKDLCERHEKGMLHRHQRALYRSMLARRQAGSGREPESVEQLESCILEQENAIQTLELRSHFSLYCLYQETQLVHAYLPLTSHILGAFVNSQIQGHKEMNKVWTDLKPKLHCLLSGSSGPPTRPRSPPEESLLPR
ncbi:PREDICTED: sorting nexin-8 [Elephantulus edwardii]|uniref:sorting nexin-8 n=1 Tax=Elephantulus edwardii TaxID=28737 RepID=UPI0003F0C771|nr:PREDICTED: sorting nexin-8 [Elephantulus edwardii]